MPGYEPFLLCDFHVHTRWSDGRLSLRDTIDLYGRTGRFDVLAITDHILMRRDWLARAGRLASLGQRTFGIPEARFGEYLDEVRQEAERARREYRPARGARRRDHAEQASRPKERTHHRARPQAVHLRRPVAR